MESSLAQSARLSHRMNPQPITVSFRNCRLRWALCLALLLPVHAFGWGATGHRVIALIAEENLTPQAEAAVQAIIGPETLVDVANWPDWIRSDPAWGFSAPWHYVNVPDGMAYDESTANPAGDVYAKINDFIAVLRDPGTSIEDKAVALKWIVHLVGDIHQPLHAGRAEDRGGNSIKCTWFGEETNLHRIWDSEIIDATKLSYTELSDAIQRMVTVEIESGPEPEPMLWLEESRACAVQAYTPPGDGASGTYRYIFDNTSLVEQRLLQAGLRLALTLNYALGDTEVWSNMPNGLHWVRNSAEYTALCHQVYADATRRLDDMKAAGELSGNWTVAIDADETLLDNSLEAKERAGKKFNVEDWHAWCRRAEAPAVPGATEFVQRVKALGGVVAVVSNRSVKVQAATEANLRSLGMYVDVVLLKSDTSDKTPRWDILEKGETGLPPLRLVMFVGDNIYDFPGMSQDPPAAEDASFFSEFGRKYFLLPNPVYGSWLGTPRR